MTIYKVFRRAEWEAFRSAGRTDGAPVDLADGYIHLSTAGQLGETLSRHFGGETGLVLCAVSTKQDDDALRWEPSRGGALFPHLYRPLRIEDVLWHEDLAVQGGRHELPDRVS